MNYGKAIRIARSIAGLSQARLAAQSGIDRSYLSLIEGGDRKPENCQQMKMSLHAPRALLHRHHRSNDLFTAPAAKSLAGLHRGTASIAEHKFLPRRFMSRRNSPDRTIPNK